MSIHLNSFLIYSLRASTPIVQVKTPLHNLAGTTLVITNSKALVFLQVYQITRLLFIIEFFSPY